MKKIHEYTNDELRDIVFFALQIIAGIAFFSAVVTSQGCAYKSSVIFQEGKGTVNSTSEIKTSTPISTTAEGLPLQ